MSQMTHSPVIPFEPVTGERYPTGPQWTAQIKWDGTRMLAYGESGEVRLFNRRLRERTTHYPELTVASALCHSPSFILDGEVISLKDGKPSFQRIMKRDRVTSASGLVNAIRQVPIVFMVFDMLRCDGRDLTAEPLSLRQEKLRAVVAESETVRFVPNYPDAGALFEVAKSHGLEGIVCKDTTSAYAIGGKDGRWLKFKTIRDLVAVVGGVTYRDGFVNALLLGLYDDAGKLHYVGHTGSGKLKGTDWREATRIAASLRIPTMPFAARPERHRDAVWLRPLLCVKVAYLNWTDGGTLRHPVLQSFVNADPATCTTDQA